jgi:hypothetical protein
MVLWLGLLLTCGYLLYLGIKIIFDYQVGSASILTGFAISTLCYAGMLMCIDEIKRLYRGIKEKNKETNISNSSGTDIGNETGREVPAHFYDDIDRWFLD